ncbi:MAG: pyruvate synthase subunit PorB, partial [Desulfobacterales bacterium]
FPLWEYEDGQYRFTKKTAKPKPVKELTKLIGKFKHLKQEDQQPLQTMVDRRYKLVETLCEGTAA